mgnify:CR=1 FL=1
MIPENLAPAIAALASPPSAEDAANRITEYLAEHPATGLIGCRFASKDQFKAGCMMAGMLVERFEVLMTSSVAETGCFQIKSKQMTILGYWVSFGDSIQIVNSNEKDVRAQLPPGLPGSQLNRPPWER